MIINNPLIPNKIIEANGQIVKLWVSNLGTWDMVAVPNKNYTHGVTLYTVVGCGAMIRNDPGGVDGISPFITTTLVAGDHRAAGAIKLSATLVTLTRITGGVYDHADYDSVAIDRGWVWLWYI